MRARIIHNRLGKRVAGIGLNRLIELFTQPIKFVSDAFLNVAVTIIVAEGTLHTHIAEILDAGDTLMTGRGLVHAYLQGMRVVAVSAGLIAFDMLKLGLVAPIRELKAACGLLPQRVKRRRRSNEC